MNLRHTLAVAALSALAASTLPPVVASHSFYDPFVATGGAAMAQPDPTPGPSARYVQAIQARNGLIRDLRAQLAREARAGAHVAQVCREDAARARS